MKWKNENKFKLVHETIAEGFTMFDEKTKIEKTVLKKGVDYFRIFVVTGLLLILLEILLKNTWLRTPVLIE